VDGDDIALSGYPVISGFIRPDLPAVAKRLRDAGDIKWMSGNRLQPVAIGSYRKEVRNHA
jgi:hypothetical protein